MTTSLLIAGPVTLPTDYCSIHTGWPANGAKPVVNAGNVRLLDGSYGWMWRHIEVSPGIYDWTALDAKITAYRQEGWTVSFVIYGTPQFYASVADQGHLDRYNLPGGAAYPAQDDGLAHFTAWVTALVTRYNAAGGAWRIANPTLGKGLATLELWNEPVYTQDYREYWWGSAGQHVDLQYAAHVASKAVDPDLITTSTSFNQEDVAERFYTAHGILNPGVRGGDVGDALNFHAYNAMPWGHSYAAMNGDVGWSEQGVYPYRILSERFCGNRPIYMSEAGFDSIGSSALVSFLAESPDLRFRLLAKNMLIAAAMGCKRWGCYTNGNMSGDLLNDTDGVVRAFDLVAGLAGKTLVAADMEIGGPLLLKFADGEQVRIN